MLKKIICSIICLSVWASAYGQTLTGSWHGDLEIPGRSLTLVFNLVEGENGTECTMDSPDEGVKGIPASFSAEGLNVTFEVQSLGVKFTGINTGKMISGTFSQRGMSFPLALKPGRPAVSRPQEPKLPLPYECKELTIKNGEIELSGTLTLPDSKEVVIVMLTGSGAQNRNEELFDHKPFLVISDHLAKEGISTFRYDDRGTGASTGDFNTVTIESNTEDARSAVRYFRDLGYKKIGLLGHSEGGLLAFILASQNEADFIISLAGPAANGETIIMDQNLTALKQAGYDDEQIEQLMPQLLGSVRQQAAANPWIQSFFNYEPKSAVEATTCPVLALNGSKDVQVRPDLNLSVIKEILGEKGNLTAIEYEGLNHLFQHSIGEGATEYNKIEETISTRVLDDITNWLKTIL